MTESEWLACMDPREMLEFLRGKARDRKLRLFACGCCRRVWHLLTMEATRGAVEVAERFADGRGGREGLEAARAGVAAAIRMLDDLAEDAYNVGYGRAGFDAQARAAAAAASEDATRASEDAATAVFLAAGEAETGATYLAACRAAHDAERREQVRLLHDLFGTLGYRPVPLSPAWQSPQVVALAQAAYDQRELPAGTLDPARLGVLADALEDAGCDQADVLGHLRGPGPHVRGCWALDLLLGKG
jgi:hypothetical protein